MPSSALRKCSLYGYAAGNPLSFIDPTGRDVLGAIVNTARTVGRFAARQVPRAVGVIHVVGGAALAAAGGAACASGAGCALGALGIAYGVDVALAGANTFATNTPTPTYTNQGIAKLTNQDFADNAEMAFALANFAAALRPVVANAIPRFFRSTGPDPVPAGGIRANAAQGKAFEDKSLGKIEADGWTLAREVTVKTADGTRTRLDAVATKGTQLRCLECKSSATAPLTPAQTKAFPAIEAQGATVVGKGKPSVPGGTVIPPTRVEILRPE